MDTFLTNQFLYSEDIHAGYLNLGTQLSKVNVQAGLRAKLTLSDGRSVTLDQRTQKEYLDWFPSLSISHPIGEMHNLSYTYSRRINRSNYQDLNPFIYFLDPYTFGRGNPFLQPQYANSYGVTYSFKGSIFLNLNYSKTTDAITEVLEQDDENLQTFQTKHNLAETENWSITASAPVPVTKWWSARVNLVGFFNGLDSPFENGGQIQREKWSWIANVTNNLELPGGLQAEVNGRYQSSLL